MTKQSEQPEIPRAFQMTATIVFLLFETIVYLKNNCSAFVNSDDVGRNLLERSRSFNHKK